MYIAEAKVSLGGVYGFSAEDTDRVIKHLKLPKDAKILDIGTGFGFLAITLALNGYSVLTGEPEDDNTKYAKHDWLHNAEKVGVDHLIKFQAFDAIDMPFEDNTFDAIFSLGALHHVDERCRVNVLQECVRISKAKALICFFEPNPKSIKIIKEFDPAHPEAADPNEYSQGLNLASKKIEGTFDAFIFQK
jgi:SAM-dependent methyltransferase